MLVGKCVQGVLIRRITVSYPGLRLDLRVELKLFEKQCAYLLRRKDVKVRVFCHFPDPFLYLIHFRCQS